jgi:hypothetical protein
MTQHYAPRLFGGAVPYLVARPVPDAEDAGNYTVVVDGKQQFCLAGSLSIQSKIGKRSQARCVIHSSIETHFQDGQDIQIFNQDGTLIFNGYLETPEERSSRTGFTLLHRLSAVDGHYLADKRRVAKAYVNKTCGAMVYDLWNVYLRPEGVTIGAIYDGPTPSQYLYPSDTLYPGGNVTLIPSAVFAYCRISEALDALAKQASYAGIPYYWQIDEQKALWFVPYTFVRKSGITDGTTIDSVYNPCIVTRAQPKYHNTKWITGATVQTTTQTKIIGDGQATSFTMDYPLYSEPTITVASVKKTVGIKGTDTGKDWYWTPGDPVIAQDSGGTLLTAGQGSVSYIGQYPTTFYAQDSAQVAYQRSLDNSTGIVEDAEEDKTITSFDAGVSAVSQDLARYATQGMQIEFSTLDPSYQQGQLITVDLDDHDIDMEEMLVESVTADDSDGFNIWFRVNAIAGPYDTTWVDFFSSLLKTPQKPEDISVGVSQVVNVLQQFTATTKVSATLKVKAIGGLVPSNTLFPSATLYPM